SRTTRPIISTAVVRYHVTILFLYAKPIIHSLSPTLLTPVSSPPLLSHSHLTPPRGFQSCKRCRGRHGHKRAPDVPQAVQPAILNLKREEHSARPKHSPGFRKSAVLQLI